MTGPTLTYKPNDDPSFKATGAWYCALPGVAPGGYSTQDTESGPSGGDAVVMKELFRVPAQRALACIRLNQPLDSHDVVALWLHFHEFLHCKVRLDELGVALPSDLRVYSHPGTPIAGFVHACGCGFACNSFTRVLRFRSAPRDAYPEFLDWFEAHLALLDMVA